ncbi:winged helix-turn-helix domain-containing protein [Streptomyces melanogenes]|uniref:Winged helix-turn-helix domain-containing protein n=1 Tax=Streptomyces melanogenes TaxID=67326 RepID=A0ABZ1XCC2_9ACTN|nr:winged helix-turn-helix domain-containing protein [Streptomyces melanogenes]
MLRLRFTAEDLLRVTFADEPAPLMELGLAMAMVQRAAVPQFSRWQRRAREALPREATALFGLVPPTARGPMFLDPLSTGLDDGLDLVLATPASRVRAELDRVCPTRRPVTPWIKDLADGEREAWQTLERAMRAAHSALINEPWSRIEAGFQAERAWRTRLLARDGIRTTLAGLAAGGRWEGTALVFPRPEPVDAALSGHGLVLLPSVLWSRPLVALYEEAPSVLIYPAVTPLPLLDEAPADPLGVLLGRTRAAILDLLPRELSTSDIAKELGISKSSASEHAKALRDARLIVTQREGKAVWHSCTPLGLELLRGAATAW